MGSPPLPADLAHKIYDILCKYAGQRRVEPIEEDHRRAEFVGYATRGTWTEYSFGGALGCGGKVYNTGFRWYVAAWPEDEKKRGARQWIAKTNAALDKLFEEATGIKPQG